MGNLRLMTDYTVIDGLFGELLAVSQPYLTKAEAVEVQGLLDQAEYQAALETFVHIFIEGGKSATEHVFSLLFRLSGLMGMPMDDTLQSIPRLR